MTLSSSEKDLLREKYAEEREKRLRPDGNEQYQRLDTSDSLAADPFTFRTNRDAVTDHVTFTFVGAGLSGLSVGARLKEAGIESVRLIDKAGDVGGTWYWNRYPGAQCDTAAMIYLPLLEETGYMPSEKYVRGAEIRAHCQRIAGHYGLYENALFHTEVNRIEWDESQRYWRIQTSRGDDFTSKYIGLGTGPLHVAKLPGIPGILEFKGKSFHTSRWDYDYTGGTPDGAPMNLLKDKRVAIIGTGATAVQCVPQLARTAQALFVFQRTPSSVDLRNNEAIDPEWFAEIATPGWQQRWRDNFVENQSFGFPESDLVDDGWTEIARRIREKALQIPREEFSMEALGAATEDADFEKMNAIRNHVDEVVANSQTAANLKPWYRQLCKRPCFHDAYLQAFNKPNTMLVDTQGRGVEKITEKGVVANGTEYEVDCIIYASGFEVGSEYTKRAGFDPVGRGGEALSEHWAEGMRTLHGLHSRGFPNAFVVQGQQAANMISNYPHNFVDHAKTIATIVAHAEQSGFSEIEAEQAAVDAWVELVLTGRSGLIGSAQCTPGYYNNEGQGLTDKQRQSMGHPGGPGAYFAYIEDWRNSGDFRGLEFR